VNRSAALSRQATISALALLLAALTGLVAVASNVLAIAAPVLLAGGVLLLLYPILGMLMMAGTIPLEAALMAGGRSLTALIAMGVVATWGAQKLLRRESLVPLLSPALVSVALLLFAVACLSMIWADYPGRMQRQLVLFFQLMLLCVLVFDLASTWHRIAWVAKLLVLAGMVAALLTLEQYFVGGARRAGEGVVGGLNRTASTLVTIVPLAFYLLRSNESLPWRALGLGYIGVAAGAVAVTLSRMSFLIFPLVVGVHMVLMARDRGGRARLLLLGGAAAVALMLVPADMVRERAATILPYLSQSVNPQAEAASYTARGYRMRVGLEIFKDHPLLGVGYDNYREQYLNYQWTVPGYADPSGVQLSPTSPHSSHVAFLANLGMVGFTLWLALFAVMFIYLMRAWRATSKGPQTAGTFLVQAVAIAAGLQFIYGFYGDVHQDKIFWMLLGLTVAAQRLSKGGEEHDGARVAT
jgi:O-antigen ligase